MSTTPRKGNDRQPKTPTSSRSKSKGSLSTEELNDMFLLHNYHNNRGRQGFDKGLQDLQALVETAREGKPTPHSVRVAKSLSVVLKGRLENTQSYAMQPELVDSIIHEFEELGLTGINPDADTSAFEPDDAQALSSREHANLTATEIHWPPAVQAPWRQGCVPTIDPEDDIWGLLEKLGVPKNPVPDFVYGYNDCAFTEDERKAMAALDNSYKVRGAAPHFPFLCVQWKSDQGEGMHKAVLQSMRDGGAAVSAMHNFYRSSGNSAPPASQTAIFTICMTGTRMEIYINYRNQATPGGTTHWEMEPLMQKYVTRADDVFALRSMVIQIFGWGRGERLMAIKKALAAKRASVMAARMMQEEVAERQAAAETISASGASDSGVAISAAGSQHGRQKRRRIPSE